jgi:tRNA U34 5-methylaminomethyl-2-thiouridine-forming methyltransferase MnmC
MTADDQHHGIDWRAGDMPVSLRFGDPFYALGQGLAESRHVFLAGNDLPARFRDGFRIAELGFGTGLNVLAAARAWRDCAAAGHLLVTSFEAFPLAAGDAARALAAFPEIAPEAAALLARWEVTRGGRCTIAPGVDLEVIPGDARQTLPHWGGKADAWFLDGFAPARNPELWGAGLLAEVARHTAPGGTFATYTAAGEVRRNLAAAGFAVVRQAGYGRKRHMTAGRLTG